MGGADASIVRAAMTMIYHDSFAPKGAAAAGSRLSLRALAGRARGPGDISVGLSNRSRAARPRIASRPTSRVRREESCALSLVRAARLGRRAQDGLGTDLAASPLRAVPSRRQAHEWADSSERQPKYGTMVAAYRARVLAEVR